MSGTELAGHAAAMRPGLPVLFMSGYADAAVMGDGPLAVGANFVQKPFTAERLGRKVREALDRPAIDAADDGVAAS